MVSAGTNNDGIEYGMVLWYTEHVDLSGVTANLIIMMRQGLSISLIPMREETMMGGGGAGD